MSRNNYLGKEYYSNYPKYMINSKYSKNIEVINLNGLTKTSEEHIFKANKKSKVKLKDRKDDEKEKLSKNEDKENIDNKSKEDKKEENGENTKSEGSKEYINKIKELEDTINQMNSEFSKEIQIHKNEILEKEKNIKKLITSNNNLKNSLEILTQRLDKILINSNQQKVKVNKIINNNQEDLQHKLDIKEKELKNQQQLINILTKDNKNIRKILNDFGISNENNSNINMAEKIHEQYQEIKKLQKNIKELKEKNNSTNASPEKNKKKELNLNTDELNNKYGGKLYLNKNKKFMLNFIQRPVNKLFTNKSQNDLKVKKKTIYGINAKEEFNPEDLFTVEEIDILKNSFYDENRYKNFLNKITILQKATVSKEKEMAIKVKLFENQLKEKDKEIKSIKDNSKEKDNKIIELNVQNKELKKIQEDLIIKINDLANELNALEEKNQEILKSNEQIKNSIFNIDGIIEAKSKEGTTIPLLVEVKKDNITIEKTVDKKKEKEKDNNIKDEKKN